MSMFRSICRVSVLLLAVGLLGVGASAQETITGTVVSYGSGFNTRTQTGTFTLRLNRYTSEDRAQRLLGYLQSGAEDKLLNELDNEDVGTFSINSRIGPRVNVARESVVNGQRRIIAVQRRWMNFGEVRGGYRSTDYPYSVIELYIDPRTGKGEGTYIAAAKIRWQPGNGGQNQIEIEDFSTFPARLMGVTVRGGMVR
ncbi:MAG TPA: hypothetical protein VGJ02_01645 [Pyrinomonadaceae bacterium]